MPTVVDSLVIELGLDPKKFSAGEKQVLADLKRTKDEAARAAKDMEASGDRAGAFFGKVKKEAVGLFAALVGANGIKDFIASTANSNAALGRMAVNLGMSGEALSKWQQVVKQAGGTAEDATGGLQALVSAYQGLTLGQQPNASQLNAFKLLGVSNFNELKDAEGALLKMSDAAKALVDAGNAPRAAQLLGQAGIPAGMIPTLEKGSAAVRAMLEEQEKLGHAHEADTKAAAELQTAWEKLATAAKNVGIAVQTQATPYMKDFLDQITRGIEDNPKFAETLTEIGVGLTALASIKVGTGLLALLFGRGAVGAAGTVGLLAAPLALSGDTAEAGSAKANAEEADRYKPNMLDKYIEKYLPESWKPVRPVKGDVEALMGMGWTREQAEGLSVNIQRESSGKEKAVGDSGAAIGLMQWHAPRQASFKKWSGHDIRDSTRDEQLRFIDYELKNSEKKAGDRLAKQTTAFDSADVISRLYARPKDTAGEASLRSAMAAHLDPTAALGSPVKAYGGGAGNATSGQTINNTVDVHIDKIVTQATDADGVAADMLGAISRRRQAYVAQANSGVR